MSSDFLTEIGKNVDGNSMLLEGSCKLRALLKCMIETKPKIKIEEMDCKEGDIKFSVDRKDMGLDSFDFLLKHKKDIFSEFIANFVGELFVRENIEEFAKILMSIKITPTTRKSLVELRNETGLSYGVLVDMLVDAHMTEKDGYSSMPFNLLTDRIKTNE